MDDLGEREDLDKVFIDRLSHLPDLVSHHIISFLDIKDLIRLGCVSKRWQQLHLSTTSLNFDGFTYRLLESYDQRLKMWCYLDRYLFNRSVDKIERFRLFWELHFHYNGQDKAFRDNEILCLQKWIQYAVRCNVEVLGIHIGYCDNVQLDLPNCVLLAGSLKSLAVDLFFGKFSRTPSLASFSNLECLKLRRVKLPDEGIFSWISCSCKCIKELSLIDVSWSENVPVIIKSSSLESLCIENFTGLRHLYITGEKLRKVIKNWGFVFSTDTSVNICAPNLNSLDWTGNLVNQLNLGRLECLEEANLRLLRGADELVNVSVSEVLSRLSSAKVLTLNKETTMALFRERSVPLLENVFCLCIHIEGFLDVIVPALTSLLGGMCKLNTLIIKSDSFFRDPKAKAKCFGFTVGYWNRQESVFLSQLKEVTLELSCGSNGVEFAKYILEHVQNLKKMTLVHSPQLSNALGELKKSKMASDVQLEFQEDQSRGPQKRKLLIESDPLWGQ